MLINSREMSGKWDEVDPRVEWAMQVMDQEGQVFGSEVRITLPVTFLNAVRYLGRVGR